VVHTDQVAEAYDILRVHQIMTTASFMISLPDDDAERVGDSITFAKALNSDFAMFSITTPCPGTELYKNIDNYDIEITLNDWNKFTSTTPVIKTSSLSTLDLQRWLLKADCSFYLRFRYPTRAIRKRQIAFVSMPLRNG
jgi:anaerobic magnesium-protoporphyrin IX monomethyl ester cyclase